MYDIREFNKVIVHAGIMHADDIFVVAYINIIREWFHMKPIQVIRTFKLCKRDTIENGVLVADIGGGEFDHHFPDEMKEKREDGVPYAAFGLIVKKFHNGFLNETEYQLLDKKFIEPLDYHDNYGTGNHMAYAFGAFNRNWDDDNPDTGIRFMAAVAVATDILNQYISSVRALARAKIIAETSPIEGETIYLDKYAPIGDFLVNNDAVKFVGSPSVRGGYQIISLKNAKGENKKLFPKYIRGYNPGPDIYNEAGINFCHSSGFLCTFKDIECAKEFMNIFKYYKEDK